MSFYKTLIEENFNSDLLPKKCVEIFEKYIMAKYINSTIHHKKSMSIVELNKVLMFIDSGGVLDVENIMEVLTNDFLNDRWTPYKEYEEKRKNTKIVREPNTDITCKNCGKKMIYGYQLQTRSCDEAMTQFYNCLECGIMFKK